MHQNHALTNACFLRASPNTEEKRVFASAEGVTGENFGDFGSALTKIEKILPVVYETSSFLETSQIHGLTIV